MVKTKIIATIGPASAAPKVLRKMMLAGLDVARINFSHAGLKAHLERLNLVKDLNKKYRRHIRLLGDLEGYRIRIGKLNCPIELEKGKTIFLTNEDVLGQNNIVPFDYSGDLKDLKIGQHIYIDDGNICLVIKAHKKKYLETKVVVGGLLKENKGINIPQANLKFEGFTQKDKEDVEFCIKNKFDYIAQSFVRNKEDILKIRRLTKNKLPGCKIIAKIENRQGLKNLGEIIEASDGIMIARGDLGVSIPIYEVPVIQKEIIRKCKERKKFVITATQMLESMTENIRPTRAEVSDVANAIIDGSEFVMLSAETAVGNYPAEAVAMMHKIIKFTEEYLREKKDYR